MISINSTTFSVFQEVEKESSLLHKGSTHIMSSVPLSPLVEKSNFETHCSVFSLRIITTGRQKKLGELRPR